MAAGKAELARHFVEDLGLAPEAASRFAGERGAALCAAADPCQAAAELAGALAGALRALDDDDSDEAFGRAVEDLKMAAAAVAFFRKKALQGFLFDLLRRPCGTQPPFDPAAAFRFVEAFGAAVFAGDAPPPFGSREGATAVLMGLAARAAACSDAGGLAGLVREINMALRVVEALA